MGQDFWVYAKWMLDRGYWAYGHGGQYTAGRIDCSSPLSQLFQYEIEPDVIPALRLPFALGLDDLNHLSRSGIQHHAYVGGVSHLGYLWN